MKWIFLVKLTVIWDLNVWIFVNIYNQVSKIRETKLKFIILCILKYKVNTWTFLILTLFNKLIPLVNNIRVVYVTNLNWNLKFNSSRNPPKSVRSFRLNNFMYQHIPLPFDIISHLCPNISDVNIAVEYKRRKFCFYLPWFFSVYSFHI